MEKFRITVVSLPDRENLVSEIFYDHCLWAEINHEEENMKIQFYPHPEKLYWEFLLDEALEALEKAKQRMIKLGPKSPPLKFDD